MNFLSDLLTTEKDRQDFFISLFVIAFFGGILYVFFPMGSNQIDKNPHATTISAAVAETEINMNTELSNEEWEKDAYRYPDEETYIEETIIPATILGTDSTSIEENTNTTTTTEEITTETEEEEEDLIESVIDSLEDEVIIETIDTPTTDLDASAEETETVLLEEEKEILENIKTSPEKARTEVQNKVSNAVKTAPSSSQNAKKLIEEEKENEDVENNGQSFDCAIIIGAFMDQDNVKSLKQRLNKDGYNVYLSWRKGYRVIGVETPCEKSAAQKTLNAIRAKYAKDAWLLKKK